MRYLGKISFCASLLLAYIAADAQISHGGYPAMNTNDFDPGKVIYLLAPEDPDVIQAAKSVKYNSVKKVVQYAVEREVDLSPEFNGDWTELGDKRIWRVHIISPGAYSLGVLFSEYTLNKGVQVYIYDESGEYIKGSFNHLNNKEFGTLFVGHIPGEQVIIEMQIDKALEDYGVLRVGSVSHAVEPYFATGRKKYAGIGESQECEIDINCIEGEDWQVIKKSVCQITTPTLYCTGTLVNNTSYNGKPYILTAEHCLNNKVYPQNTLYTFWYENSSCGVVDGKMERSVSGSTLISTGDSIDFSLLILSVRPPREYDLYYAGWDVRAKEFTSTAGLHHPNADAMKISLDLDATALPSSVPGDLKDYLLQSNFWIRQWDAGTTEGGSSGSPLFNSSKRMIGVLSGGLAYCGDSIGYDAANDRVIYSLNTNKNDYYSRLQYGWSFYPEADKQLKRWLDPLNTGQLSIGGLSQMTLGTEKKVTQLNSITTYPNPSSGDLMLNIPDLNEKEIAINVYDISGTMVYSSKSEAILPLNLSLGFLHQGIYFVKLSSKSFSGSTRIVIQK